MSECLETLRNLEDKRFLNMMPVIDKDGFITDEHHQSVIMKNCMRRTEVAEYIGNKFEELGAEFKIATTSRFYSWRGEVAAVYDLNKYEDEVDFVERGLDVYAEQFKDDHMQ